MQGAEEMIEGLGSIQLGGRMGLAVWKGLRWSTRFELVGWLNGILSGIILPASCVRL